MSNRIWIAGLVAVVGCSSSSGGGGAPPAPVDAGAVAPAGESLTIYAFVGNTTSDALPIANGTCVFDKPGGERVEAAIGADGTVKIDGIDWALGKASLTIFGEGTAISSLVAFDKASIPALKLPPLPSAPKHDLAWYSFPAPKGATLKGAVTNAQGTYLTVTSTRGADFYQGASGSYTFKVIPNQPSSLLILDWGLVKPATVSARGIEQEFKRWLRFDQPAIAEETTRDIDLNTGAVVASTKVKVKINIPGGAAGPLGGTSQGYVTVESDSWNRALFMGAATRTDISADGASFDVDIDFAKIDEMKPVSTYRISLADGAASILTVRDWPANGFVADGMVTPPVVVEASRKLTEPFAIEGVADDAEPRVYLSDPVKKVEWIVHAPAGTKTIPIPANSGAIKAAAGKPINGAIISLSGFDVESGIYLKAAFSRQFSVK